MSAPEPPIRIDVPPGSTALVLSEDSLVVYRSDDEATGGGHGWSEVSRRGRDAVESLTLDDDAVSPPVYGEFRVETVIEATVDRVFEYVADVRTHTEYADFVESLEITSDHTVGEGVTFVQTHTGSPEPLESEVEVYDPTDSVGWVVKTPAGDRHVRYWFEPVDSGTGLEHAGIVRLDHGSPEAFAGGLEELQGQVEANLEELSLLCDILE
jgi:hypothetical protein